MRSDDPRKPANLFRDNSETWTRFLLTVAISALAGFVLGTVIAEVIA